MQEYINCSYEFGMFCQISCNSLQDESSEKIFHKISQFPNYT